MATAKRKRYGAREIIGKLRMPTVVDEYTRECLAIEVARRLRSREVLAVLADLFVRRGPSTYTRSDNGQEFAARALCSASCDGRDHDAAIGNHDARVRSSTDSKLLATNLFSLERDLLLGRLIHQRDQSRPDQMSLFESGGCLSESSPEKKEPSGQLL